LAEQFFDTSADLFAFGAESFQFFVELFDFLCEAIFFTAEALNELNGLEDSFLKASKRIGFLVDVRHRDSVRQPASVRELAHSSELRQPAPPVR
jgi:hypothetical protein